jgi:cell division protein FtsB
MHLATEFRRRARHAAFPILSACAISYFGYHAVHGEYGLAAYVRLHQRIATMETTHSELVEQREKLEHRASLLRPDSLDPDMLDERARTLLGFAHPDDLVILNTK